jgi:hypothetical protein
LLLCVAAGIGIGLALPHALQSRDGSKFFRQLLAETRPGESGSTSDGTLALQLHKNFSVHVVRSAPETQWGSDGASLYFDVVIINGGPIKLDRQALLSELEDYLTELANNTKADKFSTKDHNRHGEKVGFSFGYQTPSGRGAGGEALLYETEAGFPDANGVIMHVREMVK